MGGLRDEWKSGFSDWSSAPRTGVVCHCWLSPEASPSSLPTCTTEERKRREKYGVCFRRIANQRMLGLGFSGSGLELVSVIFLLSAAELMIVAPSKVVLSLIVTDYCSV